MSKTYFVGIDPANTSFVACLISHPDEVVQKPTPFQNTIEGIQALTQWLKPTPADQLHICIENTGVYSELLCYQLNALGFKLSLLDPFKVHKAFPAQGSKTDALDSLKIAEYGYRYQDRLSLWQPRAAIVEQIKTLLSVREQLVQQKTACANALKALKKKAVQTPAALASLTETITYLAEQIKHLQQQIKDLIQRHPTLAQMTAIVTSAKGVGLLLGAHLLVLTNGFTQTPSYTKLAQYLGISPNTYKSGDSVRRKSRSRRYGPAMVRKLLHLAARSLCTHDEQCGSIFRSSIITFVSASKAKRRC